MMDRNREARRASMAAAAAAAAAANGISRRRHRSNSLRDSPEEDGPVELTEPGRLRDRGLKKERDRDRDRERDRERERERDRDRSSRSKRRRGDRLIHGSNREDGGEDSSEESVNDDEEDEEEDGSGVVRMLPTNPAAAAAVAASMSSNHHLQHRKSFPPSATKVFRAAPVWKPGDEMIGVSVPRKARSACTKRSHDWISSASGAVGGEQIHRQASTSPVRPSHVSTLSPSPARPISPSSSNASVRKKIKPNGPKPRPPKSSSKSSSSNPEELEMEIAEVLYGLKTQSQAPSKKEFVSNDSREVNKSSSDTKSRASSPISNSPPSVPQSSSIVPLNPASSSTVPLPAVAPKRKRPRQVSDNLGSFGVRSSPISTTTTKIEMDQLQLPKNEISSPNLEKNSGSADGNAGAPYDLVNSVNSQAVAPSSEPAPESGKQELDTKLLAEQAGENAGVVLTKEEFTLPKIDSPAVRSDDNHEGVTGTSKATKVSSTVSELDNHREEKFQIDLMALPPQLRSSPEREGGEVDFGVTSDQKFLVSVVEMQSKEDDEKLKKDCKDEVADGGERESKKSTTNEDAESQKFVESKGRNIDLQLDLEKLDRESGLGSGSTNKLPHHAPKQQEASVKASREEQQTEKTAQSSSLPLPMSISSWPGGLPPIGYMPPLPSVVSMDGSALSSAPIQPPFFQPRPKRCATHCHIARNIRNCQQYMKMNAFWPAAAGSAPLFNANPCNLNVVPTGDLHGSIAGRVVNPVQDKGQGGLAIFPGHTGKDKSAQAANIADAAQRKQQILLQQAMPPVGPSNILHGPAFIFPLNQQQAAVAAASARPGSSKSPASTANMASSVVSNSAAGTATASATGQASAMSFNYPNMPANEAQYLAILPNNAYPFPIPAVGAPPNYRGTHAQAMPFFNGSIYSSPMIHPSQLQQQQPPPPSQSQQMQQVHQNPSISGGSSSSQKHLQNQQQRPQSVAVNGRSGNGSLHNFPAPKNRPSQPYQQQQQQNQHILPPQGHQLESNDVAEDSPTSDSRVSRPTMGVYSQNFAMPIHAQNFALMSPALSCATTASGSGTHAEKKQQPPQQQQGLKSGVESLPPHTFAMSFAPINGATPNGTGIDLSSMAQNHAILQSLPEATRQNYQLNQIMQAAVAAQAAQQKKNFRVSEEGKAGGADSSTADDERKGVVGKPQATGGQSIAFSRPDLTDATGSAIPGNTVIDSSARTLNLASASARTSRSALSNTVGTVNATGSQMHAQLSLQQQQQILQLQKQQQQLAAARGKTPATNNGSVFSEHLTSASSVASKFPNPMAAFPPNLLQSSHISSPTQPPQWKNSARSATSQVPSSLASSTPSSLKNLSQQPSRTQQSHTQISFGANPKSSPAPQGQPSPNTNQSPSPPMVVGSPTTSSMSKGASGSPRTTTSASASNKAGQPSTLSTQQAKNSPSVSSQKSSPAGGRSVPSILGNSHITPTSGAGTKPQMQQQQQQLPKNVQQGQLFFSNTYMQAQAPHTATSAASASNGYYGQRRRPDQPQQPPGSAAPSSVGMLSLCPPVTLAGASTSDAKAVAVAAAAVANNMKGGGLHSQGILHAAQFAAQSSGNPHQILPASFSYVHTIPAAVQVKPAEQKQPAA